MGWEGYRRGKLGHDAAVASTDGDGCDCGRGLAGKDAAFVAFAAAAAPPYADWRCCENCGGGFFAVFTCCGAGFLGAVVVCATLYGFTGAAAIAPVMGGGFLAPTGGFHGAAGAAPWW